jgi:hypothetical protein
MVYTKIQSQIEQFAFREYVSQTLWECKRAGH